MLSAMLVHHDLSDFPWADGDARHVERDEEGNPNLPHISHYHRHPAKNKIHTDLAQFTLRVASKPFTCDHGDPCCHTCYLNPQYPGAMQQQLHREQQHITEYVCHLILGFCFITSNPRALAHRPTPTINSFKEGHTMTQHISYNLQHLSLSHWNHSFKFCSATYQDENLKKNNRGNRTRPQIFLLTRCSANPFPHSQLAQIITSASIPERWIQFDSSITPKLPDSKTAKTTISIIDQKSGAIGQP